MASVLVTGGAGYIGAHTCKALVAAGHRPIVFDNLSLGQSRFVRWGPLVEADTRDADAVAAALQTHACEAVVHFAALSSVGESMREAERYHDNNVGGLNGVLAGMAQAGCRTLVFSSTAAVYGEPASVPIPETAAIAPINPYGETKAVGEALLRAAAGTQHLSSIALRYFNAAGADPEAEIGEFRAVETHLIPRALMAIQGWIDDFEVFGADFPTPDGTAVRDYVHVSDLADAHVLALDRALKTPVSEVFNVGTGRGWSVAEVLTAVRRVTGVDLGTPQGARRAGDPAVLVANADRARDALGFRPRLSDLDRIVETAWAWHQHAHPPRR